MWCIGMSCHELETRHGSKYSLDGSESELDQVTEIVNSVKTASWLMVDLRQFTKAGLSPRVILVFLKGAMT